jgi:hypothetical protein
LFGTIGQGLAGRSSVLTLPEMLIVGACLGASAGGLVALFCGYQLRRGFCYLFGAALACIGCIFLSEGTSADSSPILEAVIALGVIFLGVLVGAAVRRFVTRFGAKSRLWAGIGAGGFLPLGAALAYFSEGPFPQIFIPWVLMAFIVGGWIGALAGAIDWRTTDIRKGILLVLALTVVGALIGYKPRPGPSPIPPTIAAR